MASENCQTLSASHLGLCPLSVPSRSGLHVRVFLQHPKLVPASKLFVCGSFHLDCSCPSYPRGSVSHPICSCLMSASQMPSWWSKWALSLHSSSQFSYPVLFFFIAVITAWNKAHQWLNIYRLYLPWGQGLAFWWLSPVLSMMLGMKETLSKYLLDECVSETSPDPPFILLASAVTMAASLAPVEARWLRGFQ